MHNKAVSFFMEYWKTYTKRFSLTVRSLLCIFCTVQYVIAYFTFKIILNIF
jgi:hypothetical protein